jgi:non-specific serine/threonine protein kinase
LVETATDTAVWGHKYDGAVDQVFAVQESISRSIVEALQVTLTAEEDRRLAQRPIADVRAYEWYLRARQEMLRFTPESLGQALDYLERSKAIAGENIVLLAAEGETYWQFVNAGLSADRTYLERAEACARRILALDPQSPHGHRVAGLVKTHRGDIQGALTDLKRALDIDPNDRDSLMWASLAAAMTGRAAHAEKWAARLVAIDPVTPFCQGVPATVAWMLGRPDVALARMTARPEGFRGHHGRTLIYGLILAANGRINDARQAFDKVPVTAPGTPLAHLAMAFRHAFDSDLNGMRHALTPEVVDVLARDPQTCWMLAGCHAIVGDVDAGIEWVRAAVDLGFLNHEVLAERDPLLENLRRDPRYQALMADVAHRTQALRA